MDWTTVIAATIAAVFGGGVTGVVSLRKLSVEKKVAEVEVAVKVREVYGAIIDDLRQQIEDQEKKIVAQKDELLNLRLQLEQSRERITALETESELLRGGLID